MILMNTTAIAAHDGQAIRAFASGTVSFGARLTGCLTGTHS